MHPSRRELLAATAATLALAGCTGDEGSGEAAQGTEPATTATDPATTTTATDADGTTGPSVQVRKHPEYGDVLVGPDEMTLYVFERDTRGVPESACTGGCADSWPPLTVEGEPTAGDGVAADLGTFEREDGSTQVAAGGWPLYYFASDAAPGDATGQGVNDVWWVVDPSGEPIRGGTTTDGGGGGYGGDGDDGGGGYGGDLGPP